MTDCYICYDKETSSNKFVSNPCQCKGTNKIHQKCLNELIRNNGSTCTICKSEFKTTGISRKEEKKSQYVEPTRYTPLITHQDYGSVETSRQSRNQNPENNNLYYRGRNIEIYATDMGNGQYQINYRPKHDCCTIC